MRVYKGLKSLPVIKDSVITIGSFDGVHSGHQKIIDRLRQLSSELGSENYIITFDPHPRSVIYPKDASLQLLSSLDEKLELFERYGVDNVVVVPFTIEFSQISALEYVEKFLVEKFNPRYLVIGYDHRFGINRSGDIRMLNQVKYKYGFDIIEIQAQEIDEIAISSTKIRNALKSGDLQYANSLLNHPYELSGFVIRGRKLGTEIGFPTANLKVENSKKLIPMDGIYACKVKVANEVYNGMLYIGDIPTIGTENKKSIEVNIFDFNDDIYGERISLKILQFLRHEEKFSGINDLKAQLHKDREAAVSFFESYENIPVSKACIAILNYNTKHLLEEFLPSVSYSSNEDAEVMLIDNASTDKSVKYVRKWFPEIKITEFSRNYGYAEAYNKALQSVKSEYCVLLNSDVLVTEEWLDPIIEFLDQNKEYAAAMPKIRSFEEKDNFEYAGAAGGYLDLLAYPYCRGRIFDHIEKDEGQYDDVSSIFWASGAAFVVRTDVFNKFGGFDKDYFAHHEEIDFCWRLHNAGYKVAVIPGSTVYHLGGGTLDYDNPRKLYLNFRNNLITLFKNESPLKLLWKLPARLILDGVAGIKFITEGKLKSVISILKAHFSFYFSLPQLIAKRIENRKLIKLHSIAKPNKDGRGKKSIVFQYYIRGRKNFSEIAG